ncbi:MAG: DUF1653 domain-containing protein [Candidatus Saccharibacteria bacterium]|nr:DUF1653 domain-containing protein [Candidatus Saccharibacteria bacterium]
MKEDERFRLHGVYKHFKGDFYILEDIIYRSDTGEKMIAYRALYGDHRLWCREYKEFFSEVDHKKYPKVEQKYRFELQEVESVAK